MIRRYLLVIALLAQAALLFYRLDLLPLWDDELYTIQTSQRPPAGIVEAVGVDVHPPLYYFLVHVWLKLPLPGTALERVRALSCLFALAATVLFDRLWLRRLPGQRRLFFLVLWVLSPCLILYARIGRSYTLQVVLAMIAIRLALNVLQGSGSRTLVAYILAASALLYTHYLPGLAVVAGTAALGLWRRQWRHLLALAAIGILYLPWVRVFLRTAGLVRETHPYWAGGNWAIENVLKLGYGFVAFHFGETIPVWAAVLGLALTPLLLLAWWRAWRESSHPPTLYLLLAGFGYFIAASWVSFAFVGARLLFLLPFCLLFLLRGLDVRRPTGAAAYAGLVLIACGGLSSYYQKKDFLNKGYLADFQEIAGLIRAKTGGQTAFILMDRFAASAGFLLHGPNFPSLQVVAGDAGRQRALESVRTSWPPLVWYIHYTRDPEAGHLETQFLPRYRIERYPFVPYTSLDRAGMKILGFPDRPTHLLEVIELRLEK